ncbi:MAG: hypothetical protein RBS08_09760 [Bdellovibrionales bacterium]|nr:hypothetical protein [Bdellovibrionales bacterium]
MALLDFSAAPPQNAQNGYFYWVFRKNTLFGENENQSQNSHFETFANNFAPQ